jgi:Fe-S-cluster containining protein
MGSDSQRSGETVTGTVELSISGRRLRLEMTVPTARVRLRQLLPLFQSVADAVVDVACQSVESKGETISCARGCGACCRQLVPISPSEALGLRELVEALPEPRRADLGARFAAAHAELERAGLLEKLLHPEHVTDAESQTLGMDYFERGLACPFLEDESCSIHADRPLACREYLVTSPAQHCAQPAADTVRGVKMPAKVSRILRQLERPASIETAPWVPLILALEWATAHPECTEPRPGTDIVRDLFSRLTKRDLPPRV